MPAPCSALAGCLTLLEIYWDYFFLLEIYWRKKIDEAAG